MSIQVKEVPYEILIRLNADSSVGGMHYRKMALVIDGETQEVLSMSELGPFPLAQNGGVVEILAGLIGPALFQAYKTIESLKSELASLRSESDTDL